VIGDWLDVEREPILMSGMIGSRQGWLEVPYITCPATAVEVAKGLAEVTWGKARRGFICPGLTCLDVDGVPDVMRGEEVQVFGARAIQGKQSLAICHPGTHSKHIDIHGEAVTGFTTFMTGELFAVLRDHSILGRTMTKGPVDWQAFEEGITRARQGGGLLHHLFGARTRVLVGSLTAESESDYLSGLLIGHEIVAMANTRPVTIVGAPELAERYQRGFQTAGSAAQVISGDTATVSGLRLIWDLAGQRKR
jgi:2-dehydro-3-deoxygalactonokinase